MRRPRWLAWLLTPATPPTTPQERARRREAQVAGVDQPGPRHVAQERSTQRLHSRGGQG